jgi:hypothetical protein
MEYDWIPSKMSAAASAGGQPARAHRLRHCAGACSPGAEAGAAESPAGLRIITTALRNCALLNAEGGGKTWD